VVEEKRKMERKRGRRRNQPPLSPMKVLPLELRKKTLDTRQRLKIKVEPAIKFSPPRILSWIRHWLQVSVSNVSSVFFDVCYKCVCLDVVYVFHICCKCFISMLRMLVMIFKCFCKCFRLEQSPRGRAAWATFGWRGPAWARVMQAQARDVRAARAHTWTREIEARKRTAAADVRTLAVP
jgi:hypothetical protein